MSKYLVMAVALLVGMASADGVIIGNAETPSMDPFCAS
jgi:hypothetical protein